MQQIEQQDATRQVLHALQTYRFACNRFDQWRLGNASWIPLQLSLFR